MGKVWEFHLRLDKITSVLEKKSERSEISIKFEAVHFFLAFFIMKDGDTFFYIDATQSI